MSNRERLTIQGTLGERAQRLLAQYFDNEEEADITVDVGTVAQNSVILGVAVLQINDGPRHAFTVSECRLIADAMEHQLKSAPDPSEAADLIMLLRHAADEAEKSRLKDEALTIKAS